MSGVTLLTRKQVKEFSGDHIPYRIHFVEAGDVQVIGGYYTLDTGAVTFLEGK